VTLCKRRRENETRAKNRGEAPDGDEGFCFIGGDEVVDVYQEWICGDDFRGIVMILTYKVRGLQEVSPWRILLYIF
jgi:hypothetical protein